MNKFEQLEEEEWKDFAATSSPVLYNIRHIYRTAFTRGFEIAESQKLAFNSEQARSDLHERKWLLKQDDSNTMYNVTYDIEILKKYVRQLMEWKNASNP